MARRLHHPRPMHRSLPARHRSRATFLTFSSILVGAVSVSTTAAAEQPSPSGPPPPPPQVALPPSPFEAGMHGFSMGLAAGLAGGYLVARDNGFSSSDWRPLVAGAGIGALGGGILGFTLGIIDNSSSSGGGGMSPGRSYLIMRGMSEGGGFGMVTGGIIGGLAALSTNKPEHILFGAAIGTLSGTVVGLMYGALQNNPYAPHPGRVAWTFGLHSYAKAEGGLGFGPGVSGRF